MGVCGKDGEELSLNIFFVGVDRWGIRGQRMMAIKSHTRECWMFRNLQDASTRHIFKKRSTRLGSLITIEVVFVTHT